MNQKVYAENFDDGPGGWYGWISNSAGPKPLDLKHGVAISRSPWWIDYNHAPPGGGYLHMLFCLNTAGPQGEVYRDTGGTNRFIKGGYPTDLTNARMTIRVKGELIDRGARLVLLVQGSSGGITSPWVLTGQPFRVTDDWSEQTVVLVSDREAWTSLGSRHDRTDMYGTVELTKILGNVNCNIMLILHPLRVMPMGPIDGDSHILRAGKDYPVWQCYLPEGYVMLDEVGIEFKG